MEKVKLTKEEFIKRSMNGERFLYNGDIYHYDDSRNYPFRSENLEHSANSADIIGCWNLFNGENEFEIVKEQPKTKIVKEFFYKDSTGEYYLGGLKTEERIKARYQDYILTGREWEVKE